MWSPESLSLILGRAPFLRVEAAAECKSHHLGKLLASIQRPPAALLPDGNQSIPQWVAKSYRPHYRHSQARFSRMTEIYQWPQDKISLDETERFAFALRGRISSQFA